MENRSFEPLPWGKIALAALPGVLRARSTRSRVLGLLLPPLLVLVATTAVEGIALRGTQAEFTASSWLFHTVGALQFAVSLALAALMYHWVEGQGPTLHPEGKTLSEELAT